VKRVEVVILLFTLCLTVLIFYSDVDIQAQLSLNQSRAEEITMREDYGSLSLPDHGDGFGDMDFNEDEGPEMLRDGGVGHSNNFFGESSISFADSHHRRVSKEDDVAMLGVGVEDDGFGAPLGQDMMGKQA